VSFVTAKRADGGTFEDAMKAVAAAVIASPRFLYIYNADSQIDGAESLDPYSFARDFLFFFGAVFLMSSCLLLQELECSKMNR
jgi:hypothetical protein